MNVVYLCLQPRSGGGASDTHVDGIVDALRALGCDVTLLDLNGDWPKGMILRLVRGFWLQVRHLAALRRADVVYVRMHPVASLLRPVLGSTPYVVEVNGVLGDFTARHPSMVPVRSLLRWGLKYLLTGAAQIITVTPGLGTRTREVAPGADVTVVPNAANPASFALDLVRPDGLSSGDYALFFGSLSPWQGVELVLDAVEADDWPSQLRLVIIGDGPERPRVEAAAERHPDIIRYLGQIDAKEIPAYVVNARVSLIPKRYHDEVAGQSPLKLYESIMAGTPVVATPLHGCTDVDSLAAGVHVCGPDPISLAQAVNHVVQQEDHAATLALARRARHCESWEIRAEAVLEVLYRALKSTARP